MLLLDALATKKLSECISQQNYCISLVVSTWAAIKHFRLYFWLFSKRLEKLKKFCVVSIAFFSGCFYKDSKFAFAICFSIVKIVCYSLT